MEALAPVLTGSFSISDLLREAAERSIEVGPVSDATQLIDAPSMSGMIMAEEVQPGLLLSGFDLTYVADNRLEMEVERSILCGLLLEGGGGALEVGNFPPVAQETGRVAIIGLGEARLCARPWHKGQRARVFGLSIKPSFFERFGDLMADDALGALQAYLEPGIRSTTLPWSPTLVDLGEATLKEPYGGSLCSLFRETQALRFTIEMAALLREEARLLRLMGRRAYSRACDAREILDRALAHPPKVLDLAGQIGINVTTLQANFKAAFGTTIFGYVRNRRLEIARVLMIEHGLSVAESGYRVGFTNAAAFTAAYRRHFGVPPSADR